MYFKKNPKHMIYTRRDAIRVKYRRMQYSNILSPKKPYRQNEPLEYINMGTIIQKLIADLLSNFYVLFSLKGEEEREVLCTKM